MAGICEVTVTFEFIQWGSSPWNDLHYRGKKITLWYKSRKTPTKVNVLRKTTAARRQSLLPGAKCQEPVAFFIIFSGKAEKNEMRRVDNKTEGLVGGKRTRLWWKVREQWVQPQVSVRCTAHRGDAENKWKQTNWQGSQPSMWDCAWNLVFKFCNRKMTCRLKIVY